MLGVVNLDKPVGPTSHDMVALLRRLTGTRRIGHAGTLDPLASGVLPILLGRATRLSEELTGGRKRYDARIRLGATSATDDAEGPIQRLGRPAVGEDAIRAALSAMVGTVHQRPPAYSARKVAGVTAHRAARAGAPIELAPREVVVEALQLRGIESADGYVDVDIDVRCSAGTYIRAIARDLGERLGTGGYLLSLRRTEAAGLSVADSVTPARLEELAASGRLADAVLPAAAVLTLPRVSLEAREADAFLHGRPARTSDEVGGRVAAFDGEMLLGIGLAHGGWLQPQKVLGTAADDA
jgi:tRNA pseudouridine55 synthase